MSGKIVPKNLAKGMDICGADKYYYIIRSDIACYMRATDLTYGEDMEVLRLHPACRAGDHYLADHDDLFYIIKGASYRCVRNLSTDEDAIVYSLHHSCRGGDHYLSAFGDFYIIYQSRGVYRKTKNMNDYEDGEEFILHPHCKNGLYYFGSQDYYCFIKPIDELGAQYVRCKDFHTYEDSETTSLHYSVTNFLPGGLGVTMGPSYGLWMLVKSLDNVEETPVDWSKKLKMKIGYEKELSSIEQNWNVSATVAAESGGLTALLVQSQFSLPPEYGGSCVHTEKEVWSEVALIEETISVHLEAQQSIYVWAYQLGLGNEPILYCRDLIFSDTSLPPTEVPLPPAAN